METIKTKKELERFINKKLKEKGNHIPYILLTEKRGSEYYLVIGTIKEEKINIFKNMFIDTNIVPGNIKQYSATQMYLKMN